LPVRAFISIEIIAIEIQLVRRTLTKGRLKPYGLNCRAGNIFSIDIEALASKYNFENNTNRINKIFRIDKLEKFFVVIREFSWLEENFILFNHEITQNITKKIRGNS
jgi:hypothetical protein